jgi:hypothetical protein
MALRAATFMLDHARVRRDYSARVDRNNTRLRRANWKRDAGGTMELHIRQRDYDAGLFPIDIMYEVWDGFVDGTDWSTQDLFGGYVRAWEVEKRGAMLIFTLDLVGYDIIFEKTAAPAYPITRSATQAAGATSGTTRRISLLTLRWPAIRPAIRHNAG